MNEIDPRTLLALELARTDAEPSVADKLRVLQALQARLGTPPVIPTGTGEHAAPQASTAKGAVPGGTGVGKLLAVGGIMAMLGLGAGLSLRGAPPAPSTPAADVQVPSARAASSEQRPPVEPSRLAPEATSAPLPEPAGGVAKPTPNKPTARARATSSNREPDLFQALELLRRAQRALRKQEAALSLALLDELDAKFATEVLGEERRATRVLALCLSGEEVAAAKIARALLAENPATIYAARVRESCAGSAEQSPLPAPNAGK
jgi:hypothetical protein